MNVLLERDMQLVIHGENAYINQLNLDSEQLTLTTEKGVNRLLTLSEFSNLYSEGALILGNASTKVDLKQDRNIQSTTVQLLSQEESDAIEYRLGYIQAVTKADGITMKPFAERIISAKEYAEKIGDERPVSDSTLIRWVRRYKIMRKDVRSLLVKNKGKGNRTYRIKERVKELMDEVIQKHYLTEKRLTMKYIYENCLTNAISKDPDLSEDDMPSYKAITRRISAIDERVKVQAREGYFAAKNKFPFGSPVKQASSALEFAEIDHTPIDLLVVDSEGNILGTPHLTCIIDSFTRMILGYYLSLDTPTAGSVLKAIRHAVLPKSYVKEKYPDIVNSWKCFGKPSHLISDNGSDLLAASVRKVLFELDIVYTQNPKKMPFLKGKIERFLKTLNYTLIHSLDGTTFGNYIEKGDHDSEGRACLTFEELDHIIHLWIVDYYHVKKHRSIQDTPLNMWNKSASSFKPPVLPESLGIFDYLVTEPLERKLQKYGLDINCLRYNSVELMKIGAKIGFNKTVTVLYDPDNVAKIKVRVPDSDEVIEAHCTAPGYVGQGLTLREHRKNTKKFSQNNNRGARPNEQQLIEAQRKISEIAEKASKRRTKKKPGKALTNSAERTQTSSMISGADTASNNAPQVLNEELVGMQIAYCPKDFD